MRYETIRKLPPEGFKRLTGVRPETFEIMLEVWAEHVRIFGRPRKLSLADHLLLTLLYWREYRTQFHLARDFGVSESTACRVIQKVEGVLIRSGRFRLPGKRALRGAETAIEVAVVDATESPVGRPKKDSGGTTAGRRSATPRRLR